MTPAGPDRYRDLFAQEARDLVGGLNRSVLALERNPGDEAALREIYRLVHTLKGMAATMDYARTTELLHALESLLDRMLTGAAPVSADLADLLFKATDQIERLTAPGEGGEAWTEEAEAVLEEIGHVSEVKAEAIPRPRPAEEPAPPRPPAAAAHAAPVVPTIRIRVERLDRLINLAGELLIIKSRLRTIAAAAAVDGLRETLDQLDRASDDLQREVLGARMRPIGFLLDRFARSVRDMARELGKQVEFEVAGHDIELDRAILDDIHEPLIHLLRNAVSHGIESPEERVRLGKPGAGRITLSAAREVDRVAIEIVDDGRGMEPEVIRGAAVRLGFVSADRAPALSSQELTGLLFLPGFSTAAATTQVSGRGVGLNVVKSRVEAVRGTVELRSTPGQGTRFVLRFPPTLAIVEALLFRVRGEVFAVPMADVTEVLGITRVQIERSNIMLVRGSAVSLVDLAAALEIGAGEPTAPSASVLISALTGSPTGFVVDEILGRQEVVIKSLGALVSRAAACSGATILGDGRVVLILDLRVLLQGLAVRAEPAEVPA
jgi:two-component system chemotaxis sensor kinase CheA